MATFSSREDVPLLDLTDPLSPPVNNDNHHDPFSATADFPAVPLGPGYDTPEPLLHHGDDRQYSSTTLPFTDKTELLNGAYHPQVRTTLWLPIVLAILIASISTAVGFLGIFTFCSRGPLDAIVIPLEVSQGRLINPSNCPALISTIASFLGLMCGSVYNGISRAWLWRRASRAQGSKVYRWRAVASGGRFSDLYKYPFMAGGLILAAVAAAGLMRSAFLGVLVPNQKQNYHSGLIIDQPGYSGNTGVGWLISCINITAGNRHCAPSEGFDDIANAMTGANVDQHPYTTYYGTNVAGNDSDYLASLTGILRDTIGVDMPQKTWQLGYEAIGLSVTASCSEIGNVGVDHDNGMYYHGNSPCFPGNIIVFFGDANDTVGTFSTLLSCFNGSSYFLEYGLGGLLVSHSRTTAANPRAFTCNITANEGRVTSTWTDFQSNMTAFQPGVQLTGDEMDLFASTLRVVMARENAVVGLYGGLTTSFSRVWQNDDQISDMLLAETIISTGLASAATLGYLKLAWDASSNVYPNRQMGLGTTTIPRTAGHLTAACSSGPSCRS